MKIYFTPTNTPKITSHKQIWTSSRYLITYLPKDFKVEEINTPPVPSISAYARKSGKLTIHCLELKYLYKEHEFASHSEDEYRFLEGKSIKVIRNFAKEAEYREYIESLDFEFDSNVEAYRSFANPTMQEALERWRLFIDEEVEKLRKEGWKVDINDNFELEFEYSEEIFADFQESESSEWFSLSFSVTIGGEKVELLPIVTPILNEFDTVEDLP